jgi:hypothetical protein
MSQDQYTLTLTARELRILDLAAWRFMNVAWARFEEMAQKKNRPDLSEAKAMEYAALFSKDAKDAEEIVGKIRRVIGKVAEADTLAPADKAGINGG